MATTSPRERDARSVLEARVTTLRAEENTDGRLKRLAELGRQLPTVEEGGIVDPEEVREEVLRILDETASARDELAALLSQPYWWCRECGKRFRREHGAQVRCATCLGYERVVRFCRRCREPFAALWRPGWRTVRGKLCDTCRQHGTPAYCGGCGTPLKGRARKHDECRSCRGKGGS